MIKMSVIKFDEYGIFNGDMNKLIININKNILSNQKVVLLTINAHAYEVAFNDNLFKEALKNSDYLIPDSVGILFVSKFLKDTLKYRLHGPDFFLEFTKYNNNKKNKLRYFFLGSTEETLSLICKRMKKIYPNIEIAGAYSPPFKEKFTKSDNLKMIKAVNDCQPDVLWVGMTAPKQEKWVYLNKDKLNVNFISCIGATFDFFAGTTKRANPFLRDLGLEWLYRFIREPKKLKNRIFISVPKFIFHSFKLIMRK